MMNKKNIAFTVCTASYLAHAKVMADSLRFYNPGYTCYICLVDEVKGRFDEKLFQPHILITVSDIEIPPFDEMCKRYSLLELNCALKPWFALYILQNTECTSLFYFDTDILIFNSLHFLEQQLEQYSILLTPHITQPLPVDNKSPQEKHILRTGNYNAGFFGINNDANGLEFVHWWKMTLIDNCYENKNDCIASDQKWLNFVPLFFKSVLILVHPGCNLAYWNIDQRQLTFNNKDFLVNEVYTLLFIHLSGYKYTNPSLLSKFQNRYDLNDLPAWKQVCNLYVQQLKKNNIDFFSTLSCVYGKKRWRLIR